MINLAELFKDRRTPWQKFRHQLIFWLMTLVLVTIFGAGIYHIVTEIWH